MHGVRQSAPVAPRHRHFVCAAAKFLALFRRRRRCFVLRFCRASVMLATAKFFCNLMADIYLFTPDMRKALPSYMWQRPQQAYSVNCMTGTVISLLPSNRVTLCDR